MSIERQQSLQDHAGLATYKTVVLPLILRRSASTSLNLMLAAPVLATAGTSWSNFFAPLITVGPTLASVVGLRKAPSSRETLIPQFDYRKTFLRYEMSIQFAARLRRQRQPVAHAQFRDQDAGTIGIGLDLLPQFAHEDAQVVSVIEVLLTPNFLQ